MRRLLLLLSLAAIMAAMMVMGALPAFAQGQVEQGTDNANSICSFSGLNDFEEGPGPRTQSYGQEVSGGHIEPSEVKSGPPSPGTFCNAHLFPYPEGFEGFE